MAKAPTKGTRHGVGGKGQGWGGAASGKPARAFTAQNQPTPEAKSEGWVEAATGREVAKASAVEMAQLLRDLARDPKTPPPTRVMAAQALLDRAEGRAAQAIGGDPNGVPIRTVVKWEDDD